MQPDPKPTFPFKTALLFIIIAVVVIYLLIARTVVKPVEQTTSSMAKPTDTLARKETVMISYNTSQIPPPPGIHEMYKFRDATLITVMEKLKEWYQIEYLINDSINNRFTGDIPPGVSLNEALRLLEKMGHIQLERNDYTQSRPLQN